MIEKKGAVDNLEEILEEPGVEMVQWGGADFSMNVGKPRQMKDPEVADAMKKTFELSIKIFPDNGCSSPAIHRIAVLFPDPLGPKSVKNSFSATSKLMPRKASTFPWSRE